MTARAAENPLANLLPLPVEHLYADSQLYVILFTPSTASVILTHLIHLTTRLVREELLDLRLVHLAFLQLS